MRDFCGELKTLDFVCEEIGDEQKFIKKAAISDNKILNMQFVLEEYIFYQISLFFTELNFFSIHYEDYMKNIFLSIGPEDIRNLNAMFEMFAFQGTEEERQE